MKLSTVDDALGLLEALGAPARLVQHHRLVAEAAAELLDGLPTAPIDRRWVLVGAALHDAGKIRHPAEMDGAGNAHEADGRELLLAAGVEPELARVCVTHARWDLPEAALEDRLVALADKLWKGKRDKALEERVIHELAPDDFWTAFLRLDAVFEAVANGADARLARSDQARR